MIVVQVLLSHMQQFQHFCYDKNELYFYKQKFYGHFIMV